MTSRGTPLLYYGDEIAMPGGGDPDNRRDFPGGFAGDARNAFTRKGRTEDENKVWDHLAKLGKLRRELEPLRRGKTLDLLDEEQQMAFARVTEDDAVVVIFNNDTKPAKAEFDVSMIKPLSGNVALKSRLGNTDGLRVKNGKVSMTIPARTAGIYSPKR
jgi:glycosidase